MRYKQSIAKVLSIVMMVVLTQKIAGGLYLHNLLHESKQSSLLSHDTNAVGQVNCSCIDDFYAPFAEPVSLQVEAPLFAGMDFYPVRQLVLPVVIKHFHSLRAPPVSLSFIA